MAATKLVRMTVVGASVLATSVAMDIGTASAQLEVPRVEMPQVQLPPAPVAPPSLPSPPSVPQVEVPAPQLPVPDVQVPDVPVPQAPSAPGVTAPSGGAAPGSDGAPGAPGSSVGAPSGSPTAPGPSSRGARGGDSSGSLAEARGAARQRASPPISSRDERGLRREVRRLSGCAGTLQGIERRVLDLRAGLDGAEPSPRRTVAQTLDVPLTRVRRAERDGLATLRRTNRASGCATGGDATLSLSWMSLMASAGVAPTLTPLASLEDGGSEAAVAVADAAGQDRAAVRGDSASSTEGAAPVRLGDHGGDPTAPPTAASLGGDGSGGPLLTWLALAAVLLALVAASPTLLRRRRAAEAGPLDGAGGPPDEPWGTVTPAAGRADEPRGTVAPVPEQLTAGPAAAAGPASAPSPGPPTAPVTPVPARSERPAGRRHASGRAVGMAVSSAMSLAVGVAMWARRRSGGRRRR